MYNKIAMLGGREMSPFKAFGIDVFEEERERVDETLKNIIAMGYPIIFVAEDVYEACSKTIATHRLGGIPVILVIPSATRSDNLGLEAIRQTVISAIGTDVK